MPNADEPASPADRAAVKRLAGRALRQAGRAHLSELGVRPVSSSPRQWIADRGWWLVNIEFQASGWSVGSYLNVGTQYLWTIRSSRSFGHGNVRRPIPGAGAFATLEGSEADVRANADVIALAAREALATIVGRHRDDLSHLRWLADLTDVGAWETVDSAIAAALLGRTENAIDKFKREQETLDRDIAWQADLAADLHQLSELARRQDRFNREIRERIVTTREQLRLPADKIATHWPLPVQ